MKRFARILLPLATLLLFTATDVMAAHYRIGVFFWHESSNDEMAFAGIKDGFKTAGVDCRFDIRQAGGDEAEAVRIVKEFARSKPDLIYAMGTGAAKRLMKGIKDTPIVFTAVTNPVQSGITPSWQGSGRNLAGNSNWIDTAVILREFKLVVPALRKLGLMYDPDNSVSTAELAAAGQVVKEAGLALETVEVKTVDDLAPATRALLDKKVDAIWVPIDILVYKNLDRIRQVSDAARLPLLASSHRGIKDGAIFGVVVDYHALGKRSVSIALRILEQKMAPAEIPIGKMNGFRRIVNLKSAGEWGFEIPLSVLATAHQIIN